MDDAALRQGLVRLYAADYGAPCPPVLPPSGAEEDLAVLRSRCRTAVRSRLTDDADGLRVWLAQTARELFLSEPALRRGLGLEDVADFWGWFDHALWAGRGTERDADVRCPVVERPLPGGSSALPPPGV